MSSGTGPRAKGTDGSDHKFRQRVNSHYTLMALGRSRLGLAAKLHCAHLAATAASLALALRAAPEPDLLRAAAGGAVLLCTAACARSALGAAKSSAGGPAQTYCSLLLLTCALLGVALLLALAQCVGETAPLHAQLAVAAHAIGAGATAVGYGAATKLLAAFAEAKGRPAARK